MSFFFGRPFGFVISAGNLVTAFTLLPSGLDRNYHKGLVQMSDKKSISIDSIVASIRKRWNREKLSLFECHIRHAIDETSEMGGNGEREDMNEAIKMLNELLRDLHILIPVQKDNWKCPPKYLKLYNEGD